MILFYSSNWSESQKENWANWAKIVQSRGFVVVIANFTSVSKGKLFQMKRDFVKILQWVNRNCIDFGGDLNKLYVLGVKSGAHVVMHSILDATFNILNTQLNINHLPPIYAVILIDGIYDLTLHYSFEILHGIEDISVIPNLLLEKERFSKVNPKGYINTIKNSPTLIKILPNNWLFLSACQNTSVGINQSQSMAYLISLVKKHVKHEKFQSLSDDDIILSVYNNSEPLLLNQIESFSTFCSHKETRFNLVDQYAKAAQI